MDDIAAGLINFDEKFPALEKFLIAWENQNWNFQCVKGILERQELTKQHCY